MVKRSSGILLFRRRDGLLEVLLAHPGGPLFASRDVWTVPKGEPGPDEPPLAAAYREFEEETGHPVPAGTPLSLGEIVQKGGKRVTAWAVEGDLDVESLRSNDVEMEWPPRSGRRQAFPEIDRLMWCDPSAAAGKMLAEQLPLVDRLVALLSAGSS